MRDPGTPGAEVIDISVPLNPATPVWPGSEPVGIERTADFPEDDVRISRLTLNSHAGTHIDAPGHFLPQGALVESIPLSTLIGPCLVLDVSEKRRRRPDLIGAEDLKNAGLAPPPAAGTPDPAAERVLLRTRAEGHWDEIRPFDASFPGLDPEAADYLVRAGVLLVGLDAPSIEPYATEEKRTHHILLGAGIVLLETLRLTHVAPGTYELICLPLRLEGVEGSPVRAVLRAVA
ncbi:MAG: cyclase family protein [Thermoleophilia bacterium]